MKISIAMAVYNGAEYLDAQLESLFSQSLAPDEIVVCDDGSADATPELMAKWQAARPGVIRYHRNPERLGVSRNFEKAISLCSGDAIFLSDQDDVWLPEKIQIMMDLIAAINAPSGAFCDSLLVDENLNSLGATHFGNRGFNSNELQDLSSFLRRIPAAGHDMAFEARLREILLPFPDLPECHDTWIGLVLAALNRWKFTGETLTLFRQHRSNVSGSGKCWNWRRRLTEARRSIQANTFAWNETIYRELLERVHEIADPAVLMQLEDRRRHSRARRRMNIPFFRRLPLVWREVRNRRYFKYGRGWLNVVQDLFLR